MAWQVWLSDDNSLLCSLASGTITSTDVIESAKTISDFRPGLDRLTIFDESASFSALNLYELNKVKNFVRSLEVAEDLNSSSPSIVEFKTAYVCPDEMGKMILSMYNNLWDENIRENIEYEIFPSIKAALHWLERPTLKISLPAPN